MTTLPLPSNLSGDAAMPEIMLCGAHDVGELSKAFSEVVRDFGATPWFYQDGRIHHTNSRTSSWVENSRATVKKVDVCVFVILDKYGEITWNQELVEALETGTPFVVLALESSWARYTTLLHTISDPNLLRSKDDQIMVDVLRFISDFQFTIVSFSYDVFKDKLRYSLSVLFDQSVDLLKSHNQLKSLIQSLNIDKKLTTRQIDQLILLASDEYHESKYDRKVAIRRLAADEIRDADFILEICRSSEQGVQRLAFDLLPSLMPLPLEDHVLLELAQIAANMDDVGVARRLTVSIIKLDPNKVDTLLEGMGGLEEGVRRRAYEGIENHFDQILGEWGPERMKCFLQRCEARSLMQAAWVERLRGHLNNLA